MLPVFNAFGLNDWRKPALEGQPFTFRKGEPADHAALVHMHDRADVTNMAELDRKGWNRELASALRGRYRRVIVAEHVKGNEKQLAGFALAAPWDSNLRAPPAVDMLVVDPLFQGQRLGHALMDRAEDYLAQFGRPHVTLKVNERNDKAIRFYNQRGYIEQGRESYAYQNGDGMLKMSKPVMPASKVITPIRRLLCRFGI